MRVDPCALILVLASVAEIVVANGVDVTGLDPNDAEHHRAIEVNDLSTSPRLRVL